MSPRFRTRAVAILFLAATAAPAKAGILDRLRQAGEALTSGPQVLGTVVAGPVLIAPGSQETAVLIFSSTVGSAITQIRFSASDLGRVTASVKLGSTVGVLSSTAGVGADNQPYALATRWTSRVEGNPARRDFLVKYSPVIIAYALRGRPALVAHFLQDRLGDLRQLQTELERMADTLDLVTSGRATATIESIDLPVSNRIPAAYRSPYSVGPAVPPARRYEYFATPTGPNPQPPPLGGGDSPR